VIPSDDSTDSTEVTAEGGHGAVPTTGVETGAGVVPSRRAWPLYEVFVRGKRGLNHVHVGSLHAADDEMALHNARDVYTRRNEGVSIWVVRADAIAASSPDEKDPFFAPSADKVYRHPTFYAIPEEVPHL
jgi:ring-1,2-phenylacetyl-CoA epoxidase subunit PaaB